MKSILLLAVGSRGDADPIISLASSLLTSSSSPFNTVNLCIAEEYRSLVSIPVQPVDGIRAPQLVIHTPPTLSLSFMREAMERMSNPNCGPKNAPLDPIPAQLEATGAIAKYCVVPTIPFLHSMICDKAISIVVTTTLGLMAVRSLCLPSKSVINPKVFCVHFQPNVYTSSFPCYLSSSSHAITAADILTQNPPTAEQMSKQFHASYDALLSFFVTSLPHMNQFRREILHSYDDIDIEEARNILSGKSAYVKNIISILDPPVLKLAATPDFPSGFSIVPPLADSYLPADWTPQTKCPTILDFLKRHDGVRPICVSIGSMRVPINKGHSILKAILSATFKAYPNRSVILFGGDGGSEGKQSLQIRDILIDNDESSAWGKWCRRNVLQVPPNVDVKFAWLFPLCYGILCHGGAGVVAAALAAGIPLAVAPVMCDQFFWARVVEKSGVGSFVKPGLVDLTEEEAFRAIKVIEDKQVRERVRAYAKGRGHHSKRACKKLVTMLEDAVVLET